MGTEHGLSKYPYIREARRIIGRPSSGYDNGFMISEIDFSWNDFTSEFYQENLDRSTFTSMRRFLAGLETVDTFMPGANPDEFHVRGRSRMYPDSVGIAQYAIDFHPCMRDYPPEAPGNIERPGVRQAHGQAYPAQIPLRAMIPQRVDNMLVASKSIAASNAAAHSIDFSLRNGVLPYELVDNLPTHEPLLHALRQELEASGNPTQFPDTSIFNEDWDAWKPW
jgi:hypothetical protein